MLILVRIAHIAPKSPLPIIPGVANVTPGERGLAMEFIEFEKNLVGDGHLELVVTARGCDVTRFMEEAYRTLARASGLDANEPVAKLRSQLIDSRRSGEELDQIIKGYTLSRFVPFALDAIEEETVTEPMFYCEEEPTEGRDLKISIIALLKPQYELTSYEPVSVKVPALEVGEEEIDGELREFALKNADYRASDDQDATLELDGFARVNLQVTCDGTPVEGLCARDTLFQASYDAMPAGFVQQVLGMRAGELREFDFEAPAGGEQQGDEAKAHHARISVIRLMEREVPEITDAWFKENYPVFKSLEEFRSNLRIQLNKKRQERLEELKGLAVDYAILERFEGKIPDEVLEFMMDNLSANFTQSLQKRGLTKEEFFRQQNTTEKEYTTTMMLEGRRALRQGFALDALFRGRNMKLTDEDVFALLTQMAPGREEQLLEEMRANGRMHVVEEEARRNKAHQWLLDTATYEYVEE